MTRLPYTGFRGGLEHLKPMIETSLTDERFPSVMGECVIYVESRKSNIVSMKKSPHVPLRQITEEKRRGKDLGVV